jgi:peptidoglycan/LPS O-acetylase OafA/YrhL
MTTATPPATTKPREIDSLTALRGLLALWVVVYHFWNDVVRLFPALDALTPIARAGHFAVPGFFMLSGFVLAYNYAAQFTALSPRRVVAFWALRLARIYPVHFVALLVVAAMVAVSGRLGYQLTDAGYSTRDFVLNLFLIHTWVPDFRLNWNHPSWSISSEWFAYLLFPFAASGFLSRVTTPARTTALAAVCLVGTGVAYTAGPFPFLELLVVVPTFFAGTAIHLLTCHRLPAAGRLTRWVPELLLAALVVACYSHGTLATLLVLAVLFGLILSLVHIGARAHRWWASRGLVYLGAVSYSLYMTHTLAQKVLYRLLPSARFEDSDWLVKLGVTTAYAVAVVVCCLASYYLVEEPCRKWFRRRLAQHERPG